MDQEVQRGREEKGKERRILRGGEEKLGERGKAKRIGRMRRNIKDK